MRLALYGATGMIGQRILQEALRRGHAVTAIVRDPAKLAETAPNLTVVTGDILDAGKVARDVAGHDAVISAFSPRGGSDAVYLDVARSLIQGLRDAGVKRLLLVGGAGSLEVAPGVQLVDTPQFPALYRSRALGQRDELAFYRAQAGGLDWTYFSPAALIQPGERTGVFRLGGDSLLTDPEGQSRISAEDYAVALLDEIESPHHVHQRFTVAY